MVGPRDGPTPLASERDATTTRRLVERLERLLERLGPVGQAGSGERDDETREELQALGYLQDG